MMVPWKEEILTIHGDIEPLLPWQADGQGLGANSRVSCPIVSLLNLALEDDWVVHLPWSLKQQLGL